MDWSTIWQSFQPYILEVLFGVISIILLLIKLSKKRLTTIINSYFSTSDNVVTNASIKSNREDLKTSVISTQVVNDNLSKCRYFVRSSSGEKIYLTDKSIEKEEI